MKKPVIRKEAGGEDGAPIGEADACSFACSSDSGRGRALFPLTERSRASALSNRAKLTEGGPSGGSKIGFPVFSCVEGPEGRRAVRLISAASPVASWPGGSSDSFVALGDTCYRFRRVRSVLD